MIKIKIPLDQNMVLKACLINQNLQKFNPSLRSTKCSKFLTQIRIRILFKTHLRHLLTNKIPLCFSTNNKRPSEIPGPNMICDHSWENLNASIFHHLLLQTNIQFHEISIEEYRSLKYNTVARKPMETQLVVYSWFNIDFISWLLTMGISYLFWKQIHQSEIQKFYLQTQAGELKTITSVFWLDLNHVE